VEALCSVETVVILQQREQQLETHAVLGSVAVRWKRVALSVGFVGVAYVFPLFHGHAQRCFCLLVFVTSLWILAALPYFSTALLIPPLVVLFRVIPDPTDPSKDMLPSVVAGKVLGSLVDHTSILLLGSFALSALFSRFQFEAYIASKLQQTFGHQPHFFLLGVMFLGLFLSMWIGNTTAPVLLTTVLVPVLHDLPLQSSFAKALLLGIAFSCNIGGMASPIASPQNIISIMYMRQRKHYHMRFGRWMRICVPFCVVALVLCWLLLLVLHCPLDVVKIPKIPYKVRFGATHAFALGLSLLTLLCWATMYLMTDVFGDLGIIALLFCSTVFGCGILTQTDFNSLPWHMLLLLGGGHVLGEAVQLSGLLDEAVAFFCPMLPRHNVFRVTLCLTIIVAVASTFVSHTVAALIIMPLILQLSKKVKYPSIPALCCTLAISGAMAFPFTSFPNVNSLMILDEYKRPYLAVADFFMSGLPCTVLVTGLIVTLGFALSYLAFAT
jgi:phosphate transporter